PAFSASVAFVFSDRLHAFTAFGAFRGYSSVFFSQPDDLKLFQVHGIVLYAAEYPYLIAFYKPIHRLPEVLRRLEGGTSDSLALLLDVEEDVAPLDGRGPVCD